MKELGTFLFYALGTVAVIAALSALTMVEDKPTWVLPLAALLLVVVLPVALGIVLTRRGKRRAGDAQNSG